MHKRLQWNFFTQQFPWDIAEDYELADDESATRPPLNFSEAIIVLPRTEANENQISGFFQNFYNGLSREHQAWMPYIDEESRFPLLFNQPPGFVVGNGDKVLKLRKALYGLR
jgi:hypothetical protein